jgi:hypothetical protein
MVELVRAEKLNAPAGRSVPAAMTIRPSNRAAPLSVLSRLRYHDDTMALRPQQ